MRGQYAQSTGKWKHFPRRIASLRRASHNLLNTVSSAIFASSSMAMSTSPQPFGIGKHTSEENRAYDAVDVFITGIEAVEPGYELA